MKKTSKSYRISNFSKYLLNEIMLKCDAEETKCIESAIYLLAKKHLDDFLIHSISIKCKEEESL